MLSAVEVARVDAPTASAVDAAPSASPTRPHRRRPATRHDRHGQVLQLGRGYGFITPDGGDLFVHFSVIVDEGFKTLDNGARVRYRSATAATAKKPSTSVG